MLTATTYLVLLIALLAEHVQPAERFQIEDDLHGRHQAGPGRRHRARPHPRLHDRRHDAAGDHGACSATSSSCGRSTTRTRSTSPALENIYDADGKVDRQERPHDAQPITIATTSRSDADGNGKALSTNEHEHAITDVEHAAAKPCTTSAVREGLLRARVPQYGKLRFLDRKGVDVAKGISVGNEWTYRSFIEGGTPAAAIWTFSGINESVLRDG